MWPLLQSVSEVVSHRVPDKLKCQYAMPDTRGSLAPGHVNEQSC